MKYLCMRRLFKCLPTVQCLLALLVFSFMAFPSAVSALQLRLLVWEGYAPEPQRLAFQDFVREKYGLELEVTVNYINEAEDIYRALRLKTADVISPSHNHINDKYFRLFDLGLVLPINLQNIPHYQSLADSFKDLPHLTHGGQAFGVPFAWGPYGLIYNADLINTPPVSWNSLWDAKYRKKYTIADLGEHNVYITALALGYSEEALGRYDDLNDPLFREKLKQLAGNSHHLWKGVDTADDLEGMMLATSWGFSLSKVKSNGQNWKWAPLQEKVPSWIDNFLISHTLKDKPLLKKIAEEWLNFVLGPEFQANVVVRDLAARPVNKTVKYLSDSGDLVSIGEEQNGAFQTEFFLMPELKRRTRNGFEFLWQTALAARQP